MQARRALDASALGAPSLLAMLLRSRGTKQSDAVAGHLWQPLLACVPSPLCSVLKSLPALAQAGNFRAMEKLGEPIMKPFLQVGAARQHACRDTAAVILVNLVTSARSARHFP